MKTFRQYLAEASGKNTHLEHLEDSVFNEGVPGARSALAFLKGLKSMLLGSSKSPVNVTVKWDGAPAVICGINPENGKFFVGTKSTFNKEPKLIYTKSDVDKYYEGELAQKLKLCIENLPSLGIKNVLQGDLLFFRSSLQSMEYEGEQYISFKPNTIRYAVPANSSLGAAISAANLGIVFHTTYTGKTIADLKASFGADVSGLKSSKVWVTDATFRDASGAATLTQSETDYVTTRIDSLASLIKSLDAKRVALILGDSKIQTNIKMYVNAKVKAGENISGTKKYAAGLVDFIRERFAADIEKLKTDKGRQGKEQQLKNLTDFLRKFQDDLINIFLVSALISDIKGVFLNKLRRVNSIGTFLETPDGYKVTSPEGFVAVDKIGKAYKLVDRLEFSRVNATQEKDWA
jgi:predicted secreted protein